MMYYILIKLNNDNLCQCDLWQIQIFILVMTYMNIPYIPFIYIT